MDLVKAAVDHWHIYGWRLWVLRLLGWRGRLDYPTYLRSTHWRRKAAKVRRRQRGRCAACRRGSSLDVHHKTYAHFGYEPMRDLVGLCRQCHGSQHPWRKGHGGRDGN